MLSVDLEQSKNRVRIKGAWRIWNEHSGGQTFRQGAAVAPAESTNPDHVFEIHPVTEFGDQDVTAGWTPIDGYDDFSIAQLRGRLRGYQLSTVEELISYEQAGRAREPYLRMLRNRLEKLEQQAVENSPLAPRG